MPKKKKSTKLPEITPAKLAKMSHSEKLELFDMLERREEAQRRQKPPYEPHKPQQKIHRSQALERYLFSGNGFGKSTILVNEMHWAATGWNPEKKMHTPVPATIYLVVDDPTKIEAVILKEYRKWNDLDTKQCHKDGKPHVSRITFKNGSVIHILTHEVNLLKIEGVEMTHLFFDEPPPRHVFIGLYRGGRTEQDVQVLMAGTPLYQPWLRTDIYEPWTDGERPDIECFSGSTDDNPYINEKYMKRFGSLLSEEEKATRFSGAFFDQHGQALASYWKQATHVVSEEDLVWSADWPCVVSIDPHGSKPHHAVLIGVTDENKRIVLREYKGKARARKYMQDVIDQGWFSNFRVIDIVYDSAGNAEMTSGEGYRSFGEVINEVLHQNGIGRARGTSGRDKDDEEWIERIKDALAIPEEPDNYGQKVPGLRFHESCRGSIRDVLQVQWQYDRKLGANKPKLDISNKDFLACIKYGLASNITANKAKDKIFIRNKPAYGFKTRSQKLIRKQLLRLKKEA